MIVPRKYSDIIDELTERVRRYYGAFNVGATTSFKGFVDLDVHKEFRDTEFQASRSFIGRVEVIDVVMDVHLGEKSPSYGGRDYATGMTKWKDERGSIHFFRENWVRGDTTWSSLNVTPKG